MVEDNSYNKLKIEFGNYLVNVGLNLEHTVKTYWEGLEALITPEIYRKIVEETKNEQEIGYYIRLGEIATERAETIDIWAKETPISTKNNRIAVLNIFRRFLNERKGTTLERIVKYKKGVKRLTAVITEAEFSRIIKVISYVPSYDAHSRATYLGARDTAELYLGFLNGLTSSEIDNLRYSDFERKRKVITNVNITNKDNKVRKLEVDKRTAEALQAYENCYNDDKRKIPPLEEGTYFKNKYGKKINSRSIRRNLKKWGRLAKVKADPETLRRSFAKRQVEKIVSVKELSELLGIQRTASLGLIKTFSKT